VSLVPRRDSVASRKPRVLFLSQCLPYPPESGVTSRTFHIVKELQTEFDLTLLAYSRRTHQPDDAACRESERVLAGLVERVGTACPIASELSRVRRVWDHLRSVITRRPYTFFEYESEHFRQQLRAVTRQTRFDLVHIDSLDLYRWLNELPVVPTVCTHHSIESQLLRLQAQRVDSRVLGRYMRWQADLMEGVERERCPKFSLNVMMSPIDADKLRALAPSATTIVVPNGVDTAYFAPRVEIPSLFGSVVFVGSRTPWNIFFATSGPPCDTPRARRP